MPDPVGLDPAVPLDRRALGRLGLTLAFFSGCRLFLDDFLPVPLPRCLSGLAVLYLKSLFVLSLQIALDLRLAQSGPLADGVLSRTPVDHVGRQRRRVGLSRAEFRTDGNIVSQDTVIFRFFQFGEQAEFAGLRQTGLGYQFFFRNLIGKNIFRFRV